MQMNASLDSMLILLLIVCDRRFFREADVPRMRWRLQGITIYNVAGRSGCTRWCEVRKELPSLSRSLPMMLTATVRFSLTRYACSKWCAKKSLSHAPVAYLMLDGALKTLHLEGLLSLDLIWKLNLS